MSEETKAVENMADAAKAETPIQSEDLKDTQIVEEPKEEGVDYKAELEKLRGERDNYKQGMLNAKAKLKEKKEETPPEVEVEDLESKLEQMLESKLSKFQMAQQASSINREVAQIASSADEAELIKYHLENTIRLTGDTHADVRRAKLIANESAHKKQMSEIAAALNSKETMSTPQFSSQKQSTTGKKRELSSAELKAFKAFGISPDVLTNK